MYFECSHSLSLSHYSCKNLKIILPLYALALKLKLQPHFNPVTIHPFRNDTLDNFCGLFTTYNGCYFLPGNLKG